jgi:hypothetical protein
MREELGSTRLIGPRMTRGGRELAIETRLFSLSKTAGLRHELILSIRTVTVWHAV